MGARRVGGPEGWGPDLEKVRAPRVGSPKGGGSKGGGPKAGAQNFALFSLSRSHFRSYSLSGGLIVEFWWCLKHRDP